MWESVRLNCNVSAIPPILCCHTVRTETAAEARTQDLRTQSAWIGHPCHRIFENIPSKDFAGKLNAVIVHVFHELEVRKKEGSQ